MARPKYHPQVLLGSDSHVMQWNPVLGIFRYESSKLDFIEEFLCRNMDHCAEQVLSLLDFEDQLNCLLVCKLWNEFIGGHVFKRRVEYLVSRDEGLSELSLTEQWDQHLYCPLTQLLDCSLYKKMLAKIFLLKDMWRHREPKAKRLFCDSFVLSVKSDEERIYCGLNNGCVQIWDLNRLAKITEQELHDKGVKCIDLNSKVILTGSYDATLKATAGLDGAVILYDFVTDYELRVRCYIQAHGDLVSAVDFSEEFLVSGYEDSKVSVWSMETGEKVRDMDGHNGGVTGIQLQVNTAASSSYDGTVRVWEVERGECLLVLNNPDSFCRCVAFHGNRIVSGDFDGMVHFWELTSNHTKVKHYRRWECHTGHVVCIQLNACRIVSGSRDKSVMLNDFWLKTLNALGPKENNSRISRFLNRPLHDL